MRWKAFGWLVLVIIGGGGRPGGRLATLLDFVGDGHSGLLYLAALALLALFVCSGDAASSGVGGEAGADLVVGGRWADWVACPARRCRGDVGSV